MECITQVIDTPVVLVFLSVFLLCYYGFTVRKNLPPGPMCLPFIGSIFFMLKIKRSKKRFARYLFEEETKTYGDIIRVQLGSQNMVVLHGFQLIQEAFVKNSNVLSNRPSWLPNLKEATREGKGVIWQSGHAWKILRRFTLQTLRDFGVGKTSIEEKIFLEIEAATDFLTETAGKPTSMRHLSSLMIANVIYGIVFNRRFNYTDSEFLEIVEKLDFLFQGSGTTPIGTQIPVYILKWTDPEQVKRNMQRRKVFLWIKKHIYKEIESHEATFDKENVRDFVDLYIQTKQDETDQDIFSVGNIFRVIMDLFFAGSETTSNTVNWSMLYMIEYPDVQKRCQDEIQEKFGDRPVSWSNRANLPYVEATLLEIQRLGNVLEMSLPHTNEVDTTIGGYFIPKRTIVQANLYSSNMDPRQWDEPEIFNPERFLENGKLKKNPALMPFSIGPRICLGESLARMEMFLMFTNLLQRFTFTRENADTKHTFECVNGQITSAPLSYNSRAIKRTY